MGLILHPANAGDWKAWNELTPEQSERIRNSTRSANRCKCYVKTDRFVDRMGKSLKDYSLPPTVTFFGLDIHTTGIDFTVIAKDGNLYTHFVYDTEISGYVIMFDVTSMDYVNLENRSDTFDLPSDERDPDSFKYRFL